MERSSPPSGSLDLAQLRASLSALSPTAERSVSAFLDRVRAELLRFFPRRPEMERKWS